MALIEPFGTMYALAMTNTPACFHCKKSLDLSPTSNVQFRDTCQNCHADLHVCRNCQFFDEGAHHECRESSAEWVRDKERGNRCEYFKLCASHSAEANQKSAALSALDDLFKK
jgi:hypothetical protein